VFSNKYRYLFIIALTLYSFLNTWFSGVFDVYKVSLSQPYVLLGLFLITFLIWESNRGIQRVFGKISYTQIHPLIIQFLISLVFTGIICISTVEIIGHGLIRTSHIQFNLATRLSFLYGYRINLFLYSIHTILYFFTQYRSEKMETELLRTAHTQAELQLIRNQINPHFLFNNLNVLSSLVLTGNEDANQFIEEFAEVYRYILKFHSLDLVELRKEMDFAHHYLFLLEKRFAGGLEVSIDIPEKYQDHYLVPVAMQMLIENATKHNIISEKKPLRIEIQVLENPCRLVLSNNLQKKPLREESGQIGLKNIDERFRLVTGKGIEVRETNGSFIVEIPLLELKSHETINH
jgi:sensor histidine kinase YesM